MYKPPPSAFQNANPLRVSGCGPVRALIVRGVHIYHIHMPMLYIPRSPHKELKGTFDAAENTSRTDGNIVCSTKSVLHTCAAVFPQQRNITKYD